MTDQYAVFGNPLGHTKSPKIHSSFAKKTNQDLEYTAIEASLNGFNTAIQKFRKAGGCGANITAPFKLEAFAMATDASERAKLAGAANTLLFDGERVFADMTDGVGLVNDLVKNLGISLTGKRILLVGAGGAARGAILPFINEKPSLLVLANRTPSKAHDIINACQHQDNIRACGLEELTEQSFDVVINATSASLTGQCPALPKSVFLEAEAAYELAYGKGLTPFLALAKNANVKVLADGVGMLVEQAAEAFSIWRNIRPETQEVIKTLKIPIE